MRQGIATELVVTLQNVPFNLRPLTMFLVEVKQVLNSDQIPDGRTLARPGERFILTLISH
jgi:hypothetical protein